MKFSSLLTTVALCVWATFSARAQINTCGSTTNAGACATASGDNAEATGDFSVALGLDIQADNFNSVGIGSELFIGGENDVLLGTTMKSNGPFNFLAGHIIRAASAENVGIGAMIDLTADQAHVIGRGFGPSDFLESAAPNSLTVGYNTTVPTLFVSPNNTAAPDGAGNVGIYTSNPISRLDVRGNSMLLTPDPATTVFTLGSSQFIGIGESGGVPGGTVTGCDLYGFRAQSDLSNFVNLGIEEPTGGQQPVLTYGTGSLQFLYDDGTGLAGCGSVIAEWFDPGATTQLEVNGHIVATSITASDLRFKRNIENIDNPLTTIQRLRGTTYDLRRDEFPTRNFAAGTQYGFIAQEVKEIMPTAVVQDSRGYYGVNYTAMVPLLTEGIKAQQEQIETQQATIEAQAEQIASLEDRLARIEALLAQQAPSEDPKAQPASGATLYQNIPNPTSGATVVPYYLPTEVRQAQLLVVDINTGQTVYEQAIEQRGEGQVSLNLQNLRDGTYAYLLLIDGQRVGNKRLIIQR